MVDFREMNFNAKKALSINFQNHISNFPESMLSTIDGGGHRQCYILPKIVCATTNNDFHMEYI